MKGWLAALAALSGAVAVMAGAYGAHGISGLPADWMRTGALYQLIHAVAAVALLQGGRHRVTARLFLGGAALFAGTLYAMALGAPHWLGAITPLGGVGMIAGWVCLAVGAITSRR